ncbi:MAG: DUF362 domain-containing protein [Candidatus Methanoperedens sp.]|nr:DUF362 domain-containing protein [Candidatus Methanoperedens sp.]
MIKRREFMKGVAAIFSMVFSGCLGKSDIFGHIEEKNISIKEVIPLKKSMSKVFLIKTDDRESGIKELLKYFDIESLSGKRVVLKANYNSQDPFPASTHIDTFGTLVDALQEKGANLVLAERSGTGDTRKTLKEAGVLELANKKGVDVVILDELKSSDWIRIKPDLTNWRNGFLFAKVFEGADAIVQTCCLKTHMYGGHFTMSLKNSVGMVAKDDMSELHSSSYQRQMIAEINTAYEPEFIIMDGIKGFSKGGPGRGTLIEPGIIIASRDRVATDAVGVAVLRIYGTTTEVSKGNIFEQEQIARAVELGLGVSKPNEIEIIPVNTQAQDICSKIKNEL